MKISELLQRIDYMVLQGNLSDEVTGICHDNRMIQEGDAFICISGARFNRVQRKHSIFQLKSQLNLMLIAKQQLCRSHLQEI